MQQTTAKNDSKSEETHKAIVSKFQHQQTNSKVSKISSKTFTVVSKCYKDHVNVLWK